MDFEVRVGKEIRVYDQYHLALNFIDSHLAQWNNFNPDSILEIWVRKIPSQTDTIGINVKEEINTKEQIS